MLLNLTDTWFTKLALAEGAIEVNKVAVLLGYEDDLVIRALVALIVALTLWLFGKSYLLWILNIGLVLVVSWNALTLVLLQTYV